jgi:hypothetical protein
MVNGKWSTLNQLKELEIMRPHQNLEAWSKALEFVVDVYKHTERFPKEERYGLTSQVRRARTLPGS